MPIPSLNEAEIKCITKASKTLQEQRQQESVETSKNKILLLNAKKEDDHWVNLSEARLRHECMGGLYAGSLFTGIQKCGPTDYEVTVELKHVDIAQSILSGYLNIKGLTSEFPELTTFFEGEIIGPRYSFLTRKWQAEQYIDVAHWKRFPSFKPYINIFNQDDFAHDPIDSDFVYMRWKEKFLVPDHHVDTIHGASFAGFYYICYQRSTNQIKGLYFYRHHTEWYQELTLEHKPERSFGSFEFR